MTRKAAKRFKAMRQVADRQIARRIEADSSLFRMAMGPRFFAVRSGMEAVRLNRECSDRVLARMVRRAEAEIARQESA